MSLTEEDNDKTLECMCRLKGCLCEFECVLMHNMCSSINIWSLGLPFTIIYRHKRKKNGELKRKSERNTNFIRRLPRLVSVRNSTTYKAFWISSDFEFQEIPVYFRLVFLGIIFLPEAEGENWSSFVQISGSQPPFLHSWSLFQNFDITSTLRHKFLAV